MAEPYPGGDLMLQGIQLMTEANNVALQTFIEEIQNRPADTYQVDTAVPAHIIAQRCEAVAQQLFHIGTEDPYLADLPDLPDDQIEFPPYDYVHPNEPPDRYIKVNRGIRDCRHVLVAVNGFPLTIKHDRIETFLHTLLVISTLCTENLYSTIRGLFYTNKYGAYKDSPKVCVECVNDICVMLNCDRDSLHLYTADDGKICGVLRLRYGPDPQHLSDFDCNFIEARIIPQHIDWINWDAGVDHSALFILLVESDAILSELVGVGFHIDYRCIILSGRGYPGVTFQKFLHALWMRLRLPVFALFDLDPPGLLQLTKYVCGSETHNFDSENLVVPLITWLGLFATHAINDQFPENLSTPFKDTDITNLDNWWGVYQWEVPDSWVREVQRMYDWGRKMNVGATNMIRRNYMSDLVINAVRRLVLPPPPPV